MNPIHSQSSVGLGRILMIDGINVQGRPLEFAIGSSEVSSVQTAKDALDALLTSHFDCVVGCPDDLISMAGRYLAGQLSATVEGFDRGLCVMASDGRLDWSNLRFAALPESARSRALELMRQALASHRPDSKSVVGTRTIRNSIRVADGGPYEMSITHLLNLKGETTHVIGITWDGSPARRLQEKLDAIDLAGSELVSLDVEQFAALSAQARLGILEEKILRSIHEILHFDNFEIRVLDRKTNRLDVIVGSGLLEPEPGELYATTDGNGITGYVAARGKSYICPDASADARYLPGLAHAQSSLTVPLTLHDRVVGVANFESTKPAAFSEDDRQFAMIFCRYVALALHILQLLVTERQTTAGQLCKSVVSELTGPLNDILTETESLVEDYIGHDDLRRRLRLVSDNSVRMRNALRDLTDQGKGVLGVSAPRTGDPQLAGRRVLVADDEDTMRDTLRDVLLGCGCLVATAADGSAAVKLIAHEPFDLVISDIKMPGKDGYEVFSAAQKAVPSIPVILTTGFGYDPNHTVIRASQEGLSSVLFKPFKVEQLLTEVRKALHITPPKC